MLFISDLKLISISVVEDRRLLVVTVVTSMFMHMFVNTMTSLILHNLLWNSCCIQHSGSSCSYAMVGVVSRKIS